MLYDIHILLTHAFPEGQGLPFAGFSIILIGDYYQLPPVQGHVPYKNPATTSEKAWRGRELLIRYFTVYSEFTTPNYRQQDDPGYCAICRCARMATTPTEAMLAAINARVVTIEEAKLKTAPTALWTATTHRVKDKLNFSQLADLKKKGATFFNIYARHYRLTTTTTADAAAPQTRTRKRTLEDMSGTDDFGSSMTDAPSLGNDDISNSTRRALLEYSPLLNKDGSRKQDVKYYTAQNSLQPHESFAIGCRVAITKHMHREIGLIKGARGTVIRAAFNSEGAGPIKPGASFEDAVASQIQLQIPLVLVQLDKADYKGGSCLTEMPRVVPIYAEKSRFTLGGVDYEREMLPLKLSLADTVHSAQGTSVDEHVMAPPCGQHDDFTRGLTYVALSRVRMLSGLYLLEQEMTTQTFTKWARQIEPINAEYTRLRALPHWSLALTAAAQACSEAEDAATP